MFLFKAHSSGLCNISREHAGPLYWLPYLLLLIKMRQQGGNGKLHVFKAHTFSASIDKFLLLYLDQGQAPFTDNIKIIDRLSRIQH